MTVECVIEESTLKITDDKKVIRVESCDMSDVKVFINNESIVVNGSMLIRAIENCLNS